MKKRIVRRRVRRNTEDDDAWDGLDLVEDWMAGSGTKKR
jgi:hypothetical protein